MRYFFFVLVIATSKISVGAVNGINITYPSIRAKPNPLKTIFSIVTDFKIFDEQLDAGFFKENINMGCECYL